MSLIWQTAFFRSCSRLCRSLINTRWAHLTHLDLQPNHMLFLTLESAQGYDFNGDGLPDLMISSESTLTIYHGRRSRNGGKLADRRSAARMPKLRSAIIEHLASQLQCERYHLHTGHPWLARLQNVSQANRTRQR